MRKLFAILIVATMVFGATTAMAAKNEVKSSFGALTVGGTFKAGLNFYVGDEVLGANAAGNAQAMDRGEDVTFVNTLLVLKFGGWVVDERVTYAVNLFGRALSATDSTGAKSNVSNMSIDMLDLVLGFHYIPYTGIYVGHMRPAMTYFNSLPAHLFKTVNQPLMNTNVFSRARQTGLNFGLKTPYLAANLGFYNGRRFNYAAVPTTTTGNAFGNTTYFDENTGKDIHFGLIGKPPVDGLNIRANLWYGTPLESYENDKGESIEHNIATMFINGGVDYLAPFGLTAVVDVLYGTATFDSKDPTTNYQADRPAIDDDLLDATMLSYYIMAGYNFGPLMEVPIELIVRYDYLDPNTFNDDKKVAGSEKDELTDITAGINYYIKGYHAMLSLDYINHGEAWEKVLDKEGTDDQTGINNDEIKIQAQVAF
jgi:hypothetical protein